MMSPSRTPKSPAAAEPLAGGRSTKTLFVLAAGYTLWLIWLAYVAWVNIQAGNQ